MAVPLPKPSPLQFANIAPSTIITMGVHQQPPETMPFSHFTDGEREAQRSPTAGGSQTRTGTRVSCLRRLPLGGERRWLPSEETEQLSLSLPRDVCRQQWRLRPDVQGHGHGRAVQLPRGIHPAARREDVQRSAPSREQCPLPSLARQGRRSRACDASRWGGHGTRKLSCRLHVWGRG